MTQEEKKLITDLGKCDFTKVHAYFTQRSEERKARSKEEKKAEKEKNEAIQAEYGYCSWDGHKVRQSTPAYRDFLSSLMKINIYQSG